MRNLNNMNGLYNFQDVCLLREIIENSFEVMYKIYDCNPRRFNSASLLSGCFERDISKIIIAWPTNNKTLDVFKKALTGGISCVDARLEFDMEILMPSYSQAEYNDITIDQTFMSYKRQDLKVGYKLQLDGEKTYSDRGFFISEILKLYEKNQNGYGMT